MTFQRTCPIPAMKLLIFQWVICPEHSVTRVGLPIGQIYTLDYLGIYTDASELDDILSLMRFRN